MGIAKILIVNDDNTQRGIYKGLLEEAGYVVIEAEDGQSGLDKARNDAPDVIITDVAMPKMDGLKMIEILKSEEKTKYIPVICASATFMDLSTKLKALISIGAEDYFFITENAELLLAKVTVMLRIRKLYLDLLQKNKELMLFNELAIDRELKMVELKKKIDTLQKELTKYKK